MLSLLLWISISLLTLSAAAHPRRLSGLHRRNGTSPLGKISTTVLSPNGTDVSSSFQTKVYYTSNIAIPHPDLASLNESTPADFAEINPRGGVTLAYAGRPIGGDAFCTNSRTSIFQGSHCKRTLGIPSTVQEYIVYCQETEEVYATQVRGFRPRPSTANRGGHAETSYGPHIPPIIGISGSCWADEQEYCVDSLFKDKGWPQLASCVRDDGFEVDEDGSLEEELGGAKVRMTVTNRDSRMPKTMKKLQIKAGRDQGEGSSGSSNQRACEKCSDIAAGPFPSDTESLKVEATLMTGAAMTGVLLIALASG